MKKSNGMALLIVLIFLFIMTTIISSLSYSEMIRYKLAIQQQESLKAEMIADTGIKIVRLFLIIQNDCQKIFAEIIPIISQSFILITIPVWNLVDIDTQFLKKISIDTDEFQLPLFVEDKKNIFNADFIQPTSGFGSGLYDIKGSLNENIDFKVYIIDEESKISTRGWVEARKKKEKYIIARKIYSLFLPMKYDSLFEKNFFEREKVDRLTLIANMYDWISANQKFNPFSKSNKFKKFKQKEYSSVNVLKSKNAYFDSFQELNNVFGFTPALMRAFNKDFTIYGEDKINIYTATYHVMQAMTRYCAQNQFNPLLFNVRWLNKTIKEWEEYKKEEFSIIVSEFFIQFLDFKGLKVSSRCKNAFGLYSKNFVIKSIVKMGNTTRTLTVIAKIIGSKEELYHYNSF